MTSTRRANGEGTITRRADGRYAAAIFVTRPDGTRDRKWVYARTRADVAGKLIAIALQERDAAPLPTRPPTVGEYLDYWLPEVVAPGLRPTTASTYRTAVELYLKPELGHISLDQLTVAHVQRYLNMKLHRGDSVPKVRWIRQVLSSALSRAARDEVVRRNVALLTTIPSTPRRRRGAWTVAQARTFLEAARGDAAHPVFVLALLYGLRRGEIAALRWTDLNPDTDTITVQSSLVRAGGQLVLGPTKTGAGQRLLPIAALARDALDTQRTCQQRQRWTAGAAWQETGHIFTTRTGRPVEPRNLSRSFNRIAAQTGLPPIVFHDLRRTAATLMKDLGVSARDAQVILGHSHVSVTLGIYSEVFPSQLSSAIQHMNQALSTPPSDPT